MRSHDARQRTITVLSVVITAVLLAGYVTFSNGSLATRTRVLLGQAGRLDPRVSADTEGPYAFMETQRGTDEPVGFSPCQEIDYVVNPAGAPPGWHDDVTAAVDEVARLTGLRFAEGATTEDRDFSDRVSPGGSAQPVLIGWADAEEVPPLAGDVAGIGGGTMVSIGTGLRSFVTGAVVLDTETTDRFGTGEADTRVHRALLLHELGHLVGLDHVDDRGELMYAAGLNRTDFGPGDRKGLALLGAIDC